VPAAKGQSVLYNEGNPDADAWAVALVVMTDADPSAAAIAAAADVWGTYPSQPAAGQVFLYFLGMIGNSGPVPSQAYATEGTGPGQYQVLA